MKNEIYLILDNIRSRENVGSIFRTADGAGVNKIFLCGTTPTPPHEKISKTALGAEQYVPWEYHKNTWRILKKLSTDNYQLLALEQTKKSENIFLLKAGKSRSNDRGSSIAGQSGLKANKLVLIVGNEVKGISPKILKYCDKIVDIPMSGKKESLNVSVATGIALYYLIGKQKA